MPSTAPPRRRLAASALALLLATPIVALADVRAADAGVAQGRQDTVRELVNQTRRNQGRSVLRKHAAATRRAQSWAQKMANCRCLKHRRAPYGAPRGWTAAAENVGQGRSLQGVHNAFMRSSRHKANILRRRMTHIATGVARANGRFYVVQAFYDLN